jgi:hypothetical protein
MGVLYEYQDPRQSQLSSMRVESGSDRMKAKDYHSNMFLCTMKLLK